MAADDLFGSRVIALVGPPLPRAAPGVSTRISAHVSPGGATGPCVLCHLSRPSPPSRGVGTMDMGAQELQLRVRSLSSLPLLARMRLYSDLVAWANACTSERRHAIFDDLRQWRVSMFPLLDGGNVSDLEGVSENVCCFLVECALAHCPLDAHVVGGIPPGELDISLATGMLHAHIHTK